MITAAVVAGTDTGKGIDSSSSISGMVSFSFYSFCFFVAASSSSNSSASWFFSRDFTGVIFIFFLRGIADEKMLIPTGSIGGEGGAASVC